MGARTRNEHVVYYTIKSGKIVQHLKEKEEGCIERKITKGKNEGKVVYEHQYDDYEGKIINMYKRERDVPYQKKPVITLEVIFEDDNKEIGQISMEISSSYGRGFLVRAESIDFEKDVLLSTYWIEGDDGKYRGYIGLKQDGVKIEPLYERRDGILPDIEAVEVGDETHYDVTKQRDFLISILEKVQKKHFDGDKSKPEIKAPDKPETKVPDKKKPEAKKEPKSAKKPF